MQLPTTKHDPSAAAAAAAQRDVLAKYAKTDDLGRLVCRFGPRSTGAGYLVRRVVVQGPQGSLCRLYTGEIDPLNVADHTASGWSDVADYAQPLYVPPYLDLVVLWERLDGTNIAGAAVARIEIEEIR